MTNRILLTGAGFTANFGGFLAAKVSLEIFNKINNTSKLQNLLRDNFDFEDVYQKVMNSEEFSMDEKIELTNAIKAVFKDIDRETTENGFKKINSQNFSELLGYFADPDHGGFLFTLNQDTFIEAHRGHFPQTGIEDLVPGKTETEGSPLNGLHTVTKKQIIDETEVDAYKSDRDEKFKHLKNKHVYYVKLHGSHNWTLKDSSNNLMVIGHGKSDIIKTNPLLSWYLEIFERRLNMPNTKLLIIGYGFNEASHQ